MKKKVALIFGITGQDGSYLSELLIKKDILFMVLKEDHLHLILVEIDHIYQDRFEKKETFFSIMAIF